MEMLPVLNAEAQLARIEAAAVPHMKAGDRRELLRDHVRATGAETHPTPATAAELAAIGITVKEVPRG